MALGETRIRRASHRYRSVIVVVRPDCVLHHDGRAYGEGEMLRLRLEEARKLEEQGVVLRPG
jgi:uncharacterized protein (DUF934 family)